MADPNGIFSYASHYWAGVIDSLSFQAGKRRADAFVLQGVKDDEAAALAHAGANPEAIAAAMDETQRAWDTSDKTTVIGGFAHDAAGGISNAMKNAANALLPDIPDLGNIGGIAFLVLAIVAVLLIVSAFRS